MDLLLKDKENPYPDDPREHMRGGVHTAFNKGAKAQLDWITNSPEYREEVHKVTSLLARRVIGEASKKNLSGLKITQFNTEADNQIYEILKNKGV